jgi:hypothetical protein
LAARSSVKSNLLDKMEAGDFSSLWTDTYIEELGGNFQDDRPPLVLLCETLAISPGELKY